MTRIHPSCRLGTEKLHVMYLRYVDIYEHSGFRFSVL